MLSDWDDPRLFTLTALRRRGIPPEAVNKFVAKLGMTFALSCVDPPMLDAVVRDHLNLSAQRRMAVLEPLALRIDNFDSLDLPQTLEVPDFPGDSTRTDTHTISVGRELFIEQSDFKPVGDKQFRRLTREQPVGLKHLGLVLFFLDGEPDKGGLRVRAERLTDANKPKAFIHWVANPVRVETRLYERL